MRVPITRAKARRIQELHIPEELWSLVLTQTTTKGSFDALCQMNKFTYTLCKDPRIREQAYEKITEATNYRLPYETQMSFEDQFKLFHSLTEDQRTRLRTALTEGVEEIKLLHFQGYRDKLTLIDLPESITHIGEDVFRGGKGLISMSLPRNLTHLGSMAFMGCTNLEAITLPETLTIIEDYTFAECIQLKSIILPSKLTALDACAFFKCEKLTSIVIPSTLKHLGYHHVFYGCKSLKTLTLPSILNRLGLRFVRGARVSKTLLFLKPSDLSFLETMPSRDVCN